LLILFFSFFCLGTEFKSVACPKTGVLVHLEIQRGKEGMKGAKYNGSIGATAGCTLRCMEACATAEGQQCTGIKGDAWFGSVSCAAELSVRGYEAVLQVKTNSGFYPKAYIEEQLKNAPGGVKIVLSGKAPNEQQLIAVGYRYSSKRTLFFVSTAKAGTTLPGVPYEMKFTDGFGNLKSRQVERPQILSEFFQDSNVVDSNNQLRQDGLALEESWVTTNCWFRLATTLLGMNVTDSFRLADYHGIINWGKREDSGMSVQRFAGVLGLQLIKNAAAIACQSSRFSSDDSFFSPTQGGVIQVSLPDATSERLSSVSSGAGAQELVIPERSLQDANGDLHHLVVYPLTQDSNGKKYRKSRDCKVCKDNGIRKLARKYCFTCGLSAACCSQDDGKDCFLSHVERIVRRNGPRGGLIGV
jgi:hypothetical protein